MNAEWTDFLTQQSATAGSEGFHFEQAPMQPECALSDLSQFGLLAVSGDDAESFLQGQFTNDVRDLSSGHAQLNSFCNAKGRMLSNFLMYQVNGSYFLQMPATQIAATLKRLSMYVLRAKVVIKDASDQFARIGLTGNCASDLLKNFPIEVPQETWGLVDSNGITLICLPGSEPRYEIIAGIEPMQEMWLTLAKTATPVNPDFWALQDIRAGVPSIYPETTESFIPQMTNMQLINGVSFTKGCYTGQEVVARMQYLGKLKRRMYLAHVPDGETPKPGADIISDSSSSGQGAGKVVDARPSPTGGCELLAVMEVNSAESGDIRLGDNGATIAIRELPYPFTDPTADNSKE